MTFAKTPATGLSERAGALTRETTREFMSDIDEDEPLFALSDADLAVLKAEQALVTFALTTSVSEEVRAECIAELTEAKQRNYR